MNEVNANLDANRHRKEPTIKCCLENSFKSLKTQWGQAGYAEDFSKVRVDDV